MDGAEDLIDLTTTGSADCSTVTMDFQWTNNLDGLLRDHDGNVINLDYREFGHQQCYSELMHSGYSWYCTDDGYETGRGYRKYVFRNGKLEKAARSDRAADLGLMKLI